MQNLLPAQLRWVTTRANKNRALAQYIRLPVVGGLCYRE